MSCEPSKACNVPHKPKPNPPPKTTITPTQNERQLDKVLHELQKATNIQIFESKEMTEKRKNIIVQVERLTTLWIQECLAENDSLPPSLIEKSSSYICTFGSYELNAHFASSDIDLLCIGPKHITRAMLFKEFVDILEADDRVSDILVLRHAFVPLLKFTFDGIDIDLVYAQWNIDVIDLNISKSKQINVFSKHFVQDQDTLFSLNGVRSTKTIKKLIPHKSLFEKTLRIIKFWAQQRAIYSNVMGFLGGISWSIMTAKICIQYPELTSPVDVLSQFFNVYKDYDSYQSIRLDTKLFDDMYEEQKSGNISKNSCNSLDSNFDDYQRNEYTEIMPILTPAKPTMNCAYNVIEPTKELILNEIKRAFKILQNGNIDWNLLFCKRHFVPDMKVNSNMNINANMINNRQCINNMYNDYESVYIRIQCIPDNEGLFVKKWTGFIESKIRNLVKKLNRELFDSSFYPYANGIKYRQVDNFFISGKYNIDFDHRANNEETINMTLQQFQNQIDVSSVRYDCGLKCQMKLDVCNTNEIHVVLAKIQPMPVVQTIPQQQQQQNGIQPIILKPATAQIVYPQYNILQQIQLMNITPNPYDNMPQNVYYHRVPQAQPPRRNPKHRTQPQSQPQRAQQPIFSNLNPTPVPSVRDNKSIVVKPLPPKVVDNKDECVNVNVNINLNNDRDSSDSNESPSSNSSSRTDTSSTDSITITPQNNNNNLMSFPVPNISNISSFPIIKIQQQSLPHLPPFVTTQNGHTHYPLHNEQTNAIINNNSAGWVHKMLLSQNKAKMNQNNKENILRNFCNNSNSNSNSNNNNIENNKENIGRNINISCNNININNNINNNNINNINIPKGNFIPHKRVKIPDAFVSDLNSIQSEKFGYPSPNNKNKNKNNVNNHKSTLIIHPALSTNQNINNTLLSRFANTINKRVQQQQRQESQQTAPPNVGKVSFRKRKNPYDSNNELLRSYQNYCNILTVFNINDNSNNQNVNNNVNININNNNSNNINNNPVINKNNKINIGYSKSPTTSYRNTNCYNSDSSSDTSSNRQVQNNINENNEIIRNTNIIIHEKKPKKPLYSAVITATATQTATTAPAPAQPLSSLPSFGNPEYYNRQTKIRKKASWHHHNHNNYVNNTKYENITPFARYNNNNNNNNDHRNQIYYNNDNKWRSKSNNNYRYSVNNKRHYPLRQRGVDRERF